MSNSAFLQRHRFAPCPFTFEFQEVASLWSGDYSFVLKNLVLKDFRIRYRNMSLGVLWSLLNPLVMMGVLIFVFTNIFPNPRPHFSVFLLCGLIPLSFFQVSWSNGTGAILDNAGLVKKVPVPRELFPIASVLSNFVHLFIQLGLLAVIALISGVQITLTWLWLPLILGLEVMFVTGLVLATSSLNVYVRDIRYVVDSFNTVLFWLVPVFYDFSVIPAKYADVYQYNPLSALVLAMRQVILMSSPPSVGLMLKAVLVSCVSLTLGVLVFSRLKHQFYDHL
jgi:ABC-type polysaccharide/polyol phosphate export permease